MKSMETNLKQEVRQLQKILADAQKRLANAPEGMLRVKKKRKGAEYYYKAKDDRSSINGRYMKKNEFNLAKALAQRDYDLRVVKRAEERIRSIYRFLEQYDKTCLKKLYRETNAFRRELVYTSVISDEEFVRRWKTVEYKGKPFSDDVSEILTEKGERVRSKSEKIIADKLYALGIPYRYEYPLVLDENITIYPDFTILKIDTREEVYLEHFGMLDDEKYAQNVLQKLNTYERNGIYVGFNLFMTYETGKKPLNTRALDKYLKILFCVEE